MNYFIASEAYFSLAEIQKVLERFPVDAAGDTSVEAVVDVRSFLRTFAYF